MNFGSESLRNHNDNNNAKPSGFIYVEVISSEVFNLQDFIFKTRKQSFDSSFSLCVTVTLNEPI